MTYRPVVDAFRPHLNRRGILATSRRFSASYSGRAPISHGEGQVVPWIGPMPGSPHAQTEVASSALASPRVTLCYPPSVDGMAALSPQPELGESPMTALKTRSLGRLRGSRTATSLP